MYTHEQISGLISCAKKIVDAPKSMKDNRPAYTKHSFLLKSLDESADFKGFITRNNTFAENFSIGLIFLPRIEKGNITLLRCNGMHGGTKLYPHHAYCHIHTVNAESLNAGIKVEEIINLTVEYTTYEQAIQYFVHTIGIISEDRNKYFPPPSTQLPLI